MRNVALVTSFLMLVSCASYVGEDDAGSADVARPAPGAEGGQCYPNGTCDAGLTCASRLCVRLDADASVNDGSTWDTVTDSSPDAVTDAALLSLTFLTQPLDSETGSYLALATHGQSIALVSYRAVPQPAWPIVECPATSLGTGGPKARPAHDLFYAESNDGGATWGTPVQIDQTINNPVGLSLVIAPDGTIHVGYLGGEMSRQECASSDAMIASSSDGQSWNTRTVYAGGPIGDTVGHWTSVAVDPAGQVRAAYRDVGYGLYEQIGIEKSELRYDTGGEAIDEDTGGGIYATLRFTAAGEPAIMHFNGMRTDSMGGIQLAIKRGGWQTQQLVAGGTAERPSFETDGKGMWGLAWQDPSSKSLMYIESSDLSNWSQPTIVDQSMSPGQYASLSFDSKGNPAISYYRCGAAGVGASAQCDSTQDALMFAYRRYGQWLAWEVDAGGADKCGTYSALGFVGDGPVITYRCNGELKFAKGGWVQP